MQYDSPGKKLWRYLSPILIYYGIVMAVSFICSFIITYQLMSGLSTSADMETFTEELIMKSLEASVPIYLISGLAALPFLCRMMYKDMTFRKYIGDHTALKKSTLFYCAAAGALCCLAASILVTLSQAGQVFEGYEETTQDIFSQSVLMQITAVGIVMPLVEEIVFRGLIYRRMKDYMKATMAMILSSLIFGIYHGNFIQAAYGFVMGLLMVFVFEKYQTLAAPVICHISSNLVTIFLQLLNVKISSFTAGVLVAAVCLGALYLVLKHIQKHIHIGVILNPRFIDISSNVSVSHINQDSGIYPPPKTFEKDFHKPDKSTRIYTVDDYYPKPKDNDISEEE